MIGIDHSARRSDDFNWLHQTRTRGNIAADETAEHVSYRGNGDCFDCINRACNLWGTTGEVNLSLISLRCDADADSHFLLTHAVIIERVCGFVNASWN